MEVKQLTPKKRRQLDRDNEIKAYYDGLPTGMRSMRRVAQIFRVGRSTVLRAVNGRTNKH